MRRSREALEERWNEMKFAAWEEVENSSHDARSAPRAKLLASGREAFKNLDHVDRRGTACTIKE